MAQIYVSSQQKRLFDLLPDIPDNWHKSEPVNYYTPENLFDYINGGAELYISYSLDSVISLIIANENSDEIRVEIFDMQEPTNAFGVFSHTRTEDDGRYGQGSQYFTGAQIFWKGRYFITIIANDENEAIRKAIGNIAHQIENKIQDTGKKPSIIQTLPDQNLVKDGYLYFHHYIWLNSYYFISNENIFGIDDSTNAVLAKYRRDENQSYLLVIRFNSNEKAVNALKVFRNHLLNSENGNSVLKIEDGTWIGARQTRNYFFAVFNALDKEYVTGLLSNAENRIKDLTQ